MGWQCGRIGWKSEIFSDNGMYNEMGAWVSEWKSGREINSCQWDNMGVYGWEWLSEQMCDAGYEGEGSTDRVDAYQRW